MPRPRLLQDRCQIDIEDRARQNIRLGSAAANPLSRSCNQWADGDGCVEFAPDAGVAHGLRVRRLDGWRRLLGEA